MTTPHVQTDHSNLAMRVSRNTIIGNFVLTASSISSDFWERYLLVDQMPLAP